MVYLRVGDVIETSGDQWVVVMVNDCRARCRCLSRKTRIVKDGLNNQVHEFEGTAAMINISNLIEPGEVLRHDRDLVSNINKNKTQKADTMKDKTAKTDKKTETTHTGLLGGIFGLSVTSVLRRLGKEGVTTAHAREIMKAQNVETSDITVSIQVNAGRRGKGGPPAELTAAQIKQLVSSAPAPKAPEKKEKPAKAAKKGVKAAPAKKDAKPAKPAKKAAKPDDEEAAKPDDDEEVVSPED